MGNNFPSCLPHRPLFHHSPSQQSLVFSAAFHNLFFFSFFVSSLHRRSIFLPFSIFGTASSLVKLFIFHFHYGEEWKSEAWGKKSTSIKKRKGFFFSRWFFYTATQLDMSRSEFGQPATAGVTKAHEMVSEEWMQTANTQKVGNRAWLLIFWMKFESKFATIVEDDSHSVAEVEIRWKILFQSRADDFPRMKRFAGILFLLISVFRFSSFSRLHRIALHTAIDRP